MVISCGALDCGEPLLELLETMAQKRDFSFEADRPLGTPLDAGRPGGPFDHGVERDEPLRSVWAVDQS